MEFISFNRIWHVTSYMQWLVTSQMQDLMHCNVS